MICMCWTPPTMCAVAALDGGNGCNWAPVGILHPTMPGNKDGAPEVVFLCFPVSVWGMIMGPHGPPPVIRENTVYCNAKSTVYSSKYIRVHYYITQVSTFLCIVLLH
jgi:hypothetical protein